VLPGWKTWAAGMALALPITAFALGVLGWYRDAPPVAPLATAPAAKPAEDHARVGIRPPEVVLAKAAIATPESTPAPVSYPVLAPREEQSMSGAGRIGVVVKRTEDLLSDRKWKGFTLQLASLPSMDHLPAYLDLLGKHADPATIYAHDRRYNGKNSVAVYLGQFTSEQQARNALHELPEALKINQPIVRTWSAIRQEPKP
jgi:septal ring-binding cell division protein DamX